MPANRLLPGRSTAERGDGSRIVGIREDAADDVFEALSARTAREILAALYEEPDTASSVAEKADTSLQNASYHIEKLVDAGLVEVADTWYSEQGREMKVYAPASESLVVFASDEASTPSLKDRLLRVLGVLGVLGVASVVVQRLLGARDASAGGGSGDGPTYAVAESGGEPTKTTTEQAGVMMNQDANVSVTKTAVESAAQGIPPGLLFFAGGLLVLTLALGYRYYRDR
ncbi:MAG: ArsR/SmtB family transcription factor [Halobacterium sp.]